MTFIELRTMKAKGNDKSQAFGALISKWCKTEKKKSEPSRVSNPGRYEGFSGSGRCVIIARRIHCSSI
jgi:hypothetical protein